MKLVVKLTAGLSEALTQSGNMGSSRQATSGSIVGQSGRQSPHLMTLLSALSVSVAHLGCYSVMSRDFTAAIFMLEPILAFNILN